MTLIYLSPVQLAFSHHCANVEAEHRISITIYCITSNTKTACIYEVPCTGALASSVMSGVLRGVVEKGVVDTGVDSSDSIREEAGVESLVNDAGVEPLEDVGEYIGGLPS